MYGEGAYGDYEYGGFDVSNSLSVPSVPDTVIETSETPRSWWFRARPGDTRFDLYLRVLEGGNVDFGNILPTVFAGSFSIQFRTFQPSLYGTVEFPAPILELYVIAAKKADGGVSPGFVVHVQNNILRTIIADGSDILLATSESRIDVLNFQTCTIVVDRVADRLKMFIDAREESNIDISTMGSLANSESLILGEFLPWLASNGCNVDEFRIWNIALELQDIQSEGLARYDNELDLSSLPSSLQLYCRFNEGAGLVAIDETVNGYNGVITGSEYETVLFPIDLSTDGHATYPTDAIHLQLPEAVIVPYSLASELPLELFGQVSTIAGEIVIDNSTRDRNDDVLLGEWTSRNIEIFIGPRKGRYSEFSCVAKLLSRAVSYNRNQIVIHVDDYGTIFDIPLQSNFYSGTGGLEGDETITGELRPLLIGVSRQFSPKLVDGANLIYQLNDGPIDNVDKVSDKGIELIFEGDYLDITLATPGPGEYSTSLATGYIKLGERNGKITVGARGYKDFVYGYVETFAGIVKLLAVRFAGLNDPENIDPESFNLFSGYSAPMGNYFDEPTTIRKALDLFHQSAYSWSWLRPNKVLVVGRISNPDTKEPEFVLDKVSDEINLTPWNIEPFEIPIGRVIVGYKFFQSPMGESEIDESVSAEDRENLKKQYRFVQSEDLSVFLRFGNAREITILTNLDNSVDAQALADEQLTLRKIPRILVTFSPVSGLISRGIGQTFLLRDDNLPRGEKKLIVIGVSNEAAARGQEDKIEWKCLG